MTPPLMQIQPAAPQSARRAALTRRVQLLVAATITYNVIEAVVAITAGTIASSTALIGFGLDSVIEVSSAAAVAWQFAARDPETREKVTLRIIAMSFFALAAYIAVESVRALVGDNEVEHSTVGLFLAALSLAIMPVLSYAQRRAGRELGSRTAVADSKQTLLCTYLSAVVLVGLGVNSLFGWSWADPIAALVIAAVAVKEGREAWRGDTCCTTPVTVDAARETPTADDDACRCRPGCACAADADFEQVTPWPTEDPWPGNEHGAACPTGVNAVARRGGGPRTGRSCADGNVAKISHAPMQN